MMTRHGAGTFMHPIDIENLTVTFGERVLFDAFCLRVARGEKVMVSGPSGGGKTVLLRCILGLEIPRHGVVRIFGRELNAASVWDLRRHLAYVAQEPDLGAGTVREALERPFGFKANAALRDNLDRVPALMERFRLPSDLADESMHTLSGGEKQRVALISAILLERPIILLDEASAALDPDNRDTVIAYFRQAEDTTVLSVSHEREWEAFCSRSVRIGGCSGNATLQRGSENEDARLEPGAPTTGNATLQRGSENEDARLEPGAPAWIPS